MDDTTRATCELLISNRDRVKKVFHMDYNMTQLACGGIYTMRDKEVDIDELKECKSLIKDRVGIFNNFRSYGFSTIAALLGVSDDPAETLDNGLAVYKLLKEVFFTSEYLPFAAMIIGQAAPPSEHGKLVAKTRGIYNKMKGEHLFRTGADDAGMCALMALSDKSEDELIANAEQCFHLLKPEFFSGEAVQSLSYVLALNDDDPQEACEKTMQMYDKLKESGHKYGTYYELPTLGVLALTNADQNQLIAEISEIDAWLAKQKGFGMLGGISKKHRLMYACTIAEKGHVEAETMQQTSVNAMVSLVIAQTIALYSSICASIIAANAVAGASQ